MKVTVVLNEAGKVVAAHIQAAASDASAGDHTPNLGFVTSQGEEVAELDLPDEEVPSDLQPEFLETLQRHKEGSRLD